MEKTIAVIWGDCSSPEIVAQAVRVLDRIAEKYDHTFHYVDTAMGGEAIDKYGDPLPQQELDKCLAADSVLLGAVGGPKWEGLPGPQRPEKGLLRLRAGMGLYSNNRPARIWPQLAPASPLKPEIVAKGIDLIDRPGTDRRRVFWRAPHRHPAQRRETGHRIRCPTLSRSGALAASALKQPASAAKSSAVWIKPTYWTPAVCGGL